MLSFWLTLDDRERTRERDEEEEEESVFKCDSR